MRRLIIIIVCSFLLLLFIGSPLRQIYAPVKYRELVKYYAAKYNMDWLLVSSIVYHESRYKHKAVSNKGAIGLMQIMPDTGSEIARKLGWQDYSGEYLFRPIVNLEFGCYYFSRLLKEFNNDVKLALAAYNSGKGNVYRCFSAYEGAFGGSSQKGMLGYPDIQKYLYPETRRYAARVNNTYRLLKLFDKIWRL